MKRTSENSELGKTQISFLGGGEHWWVWQGVGVTQGGLREVDHARWVTRGGLHEVGLMRGELHEVGLTQGGSHMRWVTQGGSHMR